MAMKRLILGSTALFALANPAFADVTTDDVWAMALDQLSVFGGDVTAQTRAEGNALIVSSVFIDWKLPFDIGTINVTTGGFTLTENGNGTVDASFGSAVPLLIEANIDGEGMTLAATMDAASMQMVYSGTRDDMTVQTSIPTSTITLDHLSTTSGDFDDATIEGSFVMMGYTDEMHMVREGGLLKMTGTSGYESSLMDYKVGVESEYDAFEMTGNQTGAGITSTYDVAMIIGGFDLMNLRGAFDQGMAMNVSTQQASSTSTQVTTIADQTTTQITASKDADLSMVLNGDAIALKGSAGQSTISFDVPEMAALGITGGATLDSFSVDYLIPLNTHTGPQDMRIAFGLTGLTLDDSIWVAGEQFGMPPLPRDPITFELDTTTKLASSFDMLDFAAWAAMDPALRPVDLEAARIDKLVIEGAGVKANGVADFTFDMNDTETFPDFPRPEGTAHIDLSGLDQLLDTLVASGAVPEEELMMVRMGMGMILKADGNGGQVSDIEIKEMGEVVVNGQRLR